MCDNRICCLLIRSYSILVCRCSETCLDQAWPTTPCLVFSPSCSHTVQLQATPSAVSWRLKVKIRTRNQMCKLQPYSTDISFLLSRRISWTPRLKWYDVCHSCYQFACIFDWLMVSNLYCITGEVKGYLRACRSELPLTTYPPIIPNCTTTSDSLVFTSASLRYFSSTSTFNLFFFLYWVSE